MKRNKKNTVLAVLMIALLLLGAVGGTLAYLKTQTDTVTNVFEPAKVPSEVEENFDGSTKSNVTIRNNGNVPAYIRADIVVTWKDSDGNIYPKNPVAGTDYTISLGSDWEEVGGFYYYKNTVEAGKTTTNLIVSCSPVEGKAPDGYSLNVEILGQAIQAEGMGATSAQDAWTKAAATGSTGN